jgi:2-phosphosulfolactate phosphatase
MKTKVNVVMTPAELAALAPAQLQFSTCVVFDVLRATSTMVTALHHGAREVVVVGNIDEALAHRKVSPAVILAGERGGKRICAAQTGSIDFDLGNSPREFTRERIHGKTIVMTTTNGTKAIQGCHGAPVILAGSLLNLNAVASLLQNDVPQALLLVCAGTGAGASYEDTLAAGALIRALEDSVFDKSADACTIAHHLYERDRADLRRALSSTLNGRRLAADPELGGDIDYCARINVIQEVVQIAGNVALTKP